MREGPSKMRGLGNGGMEGYEWEKGQKPCKGHAKLPRGRNKKEALAEETIPSSAKMLTQISFAVFPIFASLHVDFVLCPLMCILRNNLLGMIRKMGKSQ